VARAKALAIGLLASARRVRTFSDRLDPLRDASARLNLLLALQGQKAALTCKRGPADNKDNFHDNHKSGTTAKESATKMYPKSSRVTPPSPLLWLTLLSLDAPAVAVLWQLLFARCFHVRLSPSITLLLGLVVWLIYVADRFLDTLIVPSQGTEPVRHRFYRRRRWAFLLPFCGIFLLACWIAWTQLEPRTFRNGVIIMLAVGFYFFLVHLRRPKGNARIQKEMFVGILFGLGTCFPVWERLPAGRIHLLIPFLVFTELCWLNCAAIEYSEWMRLRQHEFNSPHPWTAWLGRHMILVASATALVTVGIALANPSGSDWMLPVAETLSAAAFVVLGFAGEKISPDKFRVLMDLALFTPTLFLVFWH
jgi:hypothetical protein